MKANIAAFSHPLLLLFWAWSLVANRCSNCAAERFSSATTNNNSSQVTDVTSISAAKNVSRECKIPQVKLQQL